MTLLISFNKSGVVCGDSLSKPEAGPVGLYNMWPHVLARKLQAAGCSFDNYDLARDGGKTDNITTKGMLTRVAGINQYTYPDVGFIFGGTNDRRSISVLTFSGTTATATSTAHGYSTGNYITVTGANNAGANVMDTTITVTDANTFTYTVPAGLTSPDGSAIIVACLQTVSHIRSLILTMKFGATVCSKFPSGLPSLQQPGTLAVVIEDNDTTGGIATPQSIYAPTITGALAGSPPSVWQCLNPNAGVTGWNRVYTSASTPTHCKKFIVVGQHYCNWSASQGDNYTNATVYSPWNLVAATQGVRQFQVAAAAAENITNICPVLYCDTYDYFENLIVIGQEVQGSFSWHVADTNIHLNNLGHEYIAEAVFNAIPTAWYGDLR